jgi:hypothetical protein
MKHAVFFPCVSLVLSAIAMWPSCQRSRDKPERQAGLEQSLFEQSGSAGRRKTGKGRSGVSADHKRRFHGRTQHGDGALLVNGKTVAYYNTVAASSGSQAGLQKFGYAMFFRNDASLNYLRKSGGWEVGSAPGLVVVDTGIAKSLSTTTLKKGIYVFFFSQKGLMGGLGLQGTKITQYTPSA